MIRWLLLVAALVGAWVWWSGREIERPPGVLGTSRYYFDRGAALAPLDLALAACRT